MNFKKIITVSLSHAYYNEGLTNELQLVPDEETKQWFQQAQLKWTQRGAVGELYVPESFSLDDYAATNPETTLKLDLVANDPLFMNYTAMPFNINQRVLFTNSDDESSELIRSLIDSTSSNDVFVSLELSLDQLPVGKLEHTYKLSLEARGAIWRYFIINHNNETGELSLAGNGSELFERGENTILSDGTEAQLFTSGANLIPFKMQTDISPELLIPSNGHAINMRLPTPLLNSLKQELVDGEEKVYADSYIYL